MGLPQASLSAGAAELFEKNIVSYDVRCTTIDDFLAANGIGRVGLLKLDTEGYDLTALRGAKKAIAERRFDLIEFEFIAADIVTGATMRAFLTRSKAMTSSACASTDLFCACRATM